MLRLALLALVLAPASVASAQPVVYQYDGGSGSQNIGPPSTFNPDMLWGNYYLTQPGGEAITEVSVAFGSTFPSRANPVTVWVLSDADGDGDPRNARSVARALVPGPIPAGTAVITVPVGYAPVGAGFFVGVSVELLGGQDRPARLDPNAPSGQSWVFYADSIAAVIDNLAAAPYGQRITPPFAGAFLVRARGIPRVVATEPGAEAAGTLQASPNPVRDATAIRFALGAAGPVTLTVVDALGRTVATLAAGERAAGEHAVRWDARGVPPGLYAARLAVGGASETLRLVVAR